MDFHPQGKTADERSNLKKKHDKKLFPILRQLWDNVIKVQMNEYHPKFNEATTLDNVYKLLVIICGYE